MLRIHRLAAFLLVLFAAGCGSGGSSDSPAPLAAPADTTAPNIAITAPSSSGSHAAASSAVNVTGTASDEVGVTQITWANSRGGDGTASGTTSWSASGIALQSGSNEVTVTARDAAGNTRSASITVTYTAPGTPAPDTTSPTTPTNLSASASSGQVNLSWMASTDNVGVVSYRVFRDDSAGPVGQPTTTSFTDSTVSADTTYVYRVQALDAAGNTSGFSGAASVMVQPPAPPPGTLMGWELNETNTGLAPHGLSCASLPEYTGPAKPAAGTTITEKRIEGYLDLSAGNITVERSCIRPITPAGGGTVVTIVSTTNLDLCGPAGCPAPPNEVTIRDSEIDGSSVPDNFAIAYACAFGGIANLQRNYMHDTGSGICFTDSGDHLSAVVENNYVTRLRAWGDAGTTGSHNESMTVRDFDPRTHPERRLVIQNNRFISKSGNDSGAFFIQPFAGYVDQVLIQNNVLESFNYGLVLEFRPNGYGTNMRAINNRFVPGGLGPGYVDGGSGWAEWRDNYLYDAAAPDGKGQPVPVLLP